MHVTVEAPQTVDIGRPTATTAAVQVAAEPSMAEYAKLRAEGKEVEIKPAAAVESTSAAAATESTSAAATEAESAEGKTTTDSATEVDPEAQIEETHPAKKGIQKRFSDLTAEKKAAQAEAAEAKRLADEARAVAAALRAQFEEVQAKAAKLADAAPTVASAEEDPAPDRAAFEDPDAYAAAVAGHAARAEIRKANERAAAARKEAADAAAAEAEKTRQAAINAQIETLHKTFNERVAAAKTELPEFDELVTNNEKLHLRNDVFFAIERAELAPHILLHIAKNPDLAESLNKLDPINAAMRLGEIQAEIRVARKPKPTKAAEPVSPVGQRASPARKSPNDETMAEYASRRDREMREEFARSRRGAG